MRGTARLCDVEKRTVLNILKLAGANCERLLEQHVRNVRVSHLECDGIWGYVWCKQKNVKPTMEKPGECGDQYTYIALEETSKLVLAWHVGKRDRINTEDFISKLRTATYAGTFDISTDAFQPYESAIDAGLYDRASHSNVLKLFSHHTEEGRERYSPAKFVAVQKDAVSGNPDLDRATTSHVERKNGTLRQWCKRLTRLTYAFSKKLANLKAALALHFAHYNLCRIHGSLQVTPAMAAGVTDRVWDISDLISTL